MQLVQFKMASCWERKKRLNPDIAHFYFAEILLRYYTYLVRRRVKWGLSILYFIFYIPIFCYAVFNDFLFNVLAHRYQKQRRNYLISLIDADSVTFYPPSPEKEKVELKIKDNKMLFNINFLQVQFGVKLTCIFFARPFLRG